ncbi:His/Gly/Thr/Pro-type tRNA ligase C-terminal domain-containing protein [Actinoplanes sp. RD1]|uniref:His/Gly/Thr/Pro-type tRNA ligase C-terminal domain-containing protein n=1 Tax=Actinoplanes sp. RD1 TaxID=3064538 RepID=UPI0035569671
MQTRLNLRPRYSSDLNATFLDAEGKLQPLVMGYYGIGVGRLLGCAAEEHRDDKGLRLPVSIAPCHVSLAVLEDMATEAGALTQRFCDELWAAGVEVLRDDRTERAGVKLADADLIGLPLRIVLGRRGLAQGLTRPPAALPEATRDLPRCAPRYVNRPSRAR